MARTKVIKKATPILNWSEADKALSRIGELKTKIDQETAIYNHNEQLARKKLTDKLGPVVEQVEALELGLEVFCSENRKDFGDKKSKELTHGNVSFRLGTPKVEKKKGFTWDGILEVVKASKLKSLFVRSKEELDKEAILKNHALYESTNGAEGIGDDELRSIHCEVVQTETFGYDIRLAVEN